MQTLIFHNPLAGSGKSGRVCQYVKTELDRHDIPYDITERAADVALLLEQEPIRVIAIGGDGTFNHLVNRAALTNLTLLPISAGTGNDFARVVHGTLLPGKQLEGALFAEPCPVDVWEVNGIRFLEGCGIGFDGLVAHSALKFWSGFPSGTRYSLAVARHLLGAGYFNGQITADNRLSYDGKLFMVSTGNGKYAGGGYKLWPAASLSDGLLDVLLITQASIRQRLLYVSMVRHGQHVALPGVHYLQTRELTVQADRDLLIHADGEPGSGRLFKFRHAGQILIQGVSPALQR
jgi:YegS/Rv2252/BmrU family lipid kinase